MSEITLYIAEHGDDANDGSEQSPLGSVAKALEVVRWESYSKATLCIRGSITERGGPEAMVQIFGKGLPPLLLCGESKKKPGVLSAKGLDRRVMSINDENTVSIENIEISDGTSAFMHGGAGVFISGSSTLTMESGSITHNKAGRGLGGGVYIDTDCEFIMRGGSITHNSTDMNGGGVMPDAGGRFTMHGGVIAHNEGYVFGGGVFVGMNSTFVLHNGIIEHNSTGGDREMELMGMQLPAGRGGGVFVSKSATFTMNGGEIRKNSATTHIDGDTMMGAGGGVYVEPEGVCTINKGVISQNTAKYWGAGVYTGGVTTLIAGTIIRNTAFIGGGVNVEGGGVFIMAGGFISDNLAQQHGGGLNVMERGVFTIEGGYINRNRVGDLGSAFVTAGTTTIEGGGITDNHNVKKLPPQEDIAVMIAPGGKLYRNGGDISGAFGMITADQLVDTRENLPVHHVLHKKQE
ncbi:MAG: right-handed parallel beta-helix repeat-containing protein [Treponema sp.]|jgi:hypothetical protein|nr:right-handed parallel beta-helix repeat-containing protein [Treponema sp.]